MLIKRPYAYLNTSFLKIQQPRQMAISLPTTALNSAVGTFSFFKSLIFVYPFKAENILNRRLENWIRYRHRTGSLEC